MCVLSIIVVKRDCSSGKGAFFRPKSRIRLSHHVTLKNPYATVPVSASSSPRKLCSISDRSKNATSGDRHSIRGVCRSNRIRFEHSRNIVRTPRVTHLIDRFSGDSNRGSDHVGRYTEHKLCRKLVMASTHPEATPTALTTVSKIRIGSNKAIIAF